MSAAGVIIAASATTTVRICSDPEALAGAFVMVDSSEGDLAFETAAEMRDMATLLASAADEWERVAGGAR